MTVRLSSSITRGNDLPVQTTVCQAQKIAAIMGAVARGHSGYTDALRDASWFLDAVVAEGRPHTVVSRSASRAVGRLWAVVDVCHQPLPDDLPAFCDTVVTKFASNST